ncbi:MAG: hypothetical protein JNM69_07315 [Archangium sp.]|nr:hypothetical protein [Archangium sp.]
MQKTLVFVAALAVGSVVGFACGTPAPAKCSVASCAGCCASDGSCQAGNTASACGTQGNACTACSAAQTCTIGACMTTTGTGGGSAAGGSAAGGAAAGGAATAGGSSAGGAAAGGRAGGAAGGGSAGGNVMLMFDAGMPPEVNISFATTCAASQPCGGALPGLWHYGSVCVEDAIFARLQQLCGGANQTQILDRSGTARGAVFFNATQMARSVNGRVDFTLTTTNSTCVTGFMGLGGCANLPALAANAGVMGTCALELPDGGASASTCTCHLRFPFNDQATDTYTTSGNVITTAGNRTFEYCVQGNTMTYEETTPTSVMNIARDPGVSTLSKQ